MRDENKEKAIEQIFKILSISFGWIYLLIFRVEQTARKYQIDVSYKIQGFLGCLNYYVKPSQAVEKIPDKMGQQ